MLRAADLGDFKAAAVTAGATTRSGAETPGTSAGAADGAGNRHSHRNPTMAGADDARNGPETDAPAVGESVTATVTGRRLQSSRTMSMRTRWRCCGNASSFWLTTWERTRRSVHANGTTRPIVANWKGPTDPDDSGITITIGGHIAAIAPVWTVASPMRPPPRHRPPLWQGEQYIYCLKNDPVLKKAAREGSPREPTAKATDALWARADRQGRPQGREGCSHLRRSGTNSGPSPASANCVSGRLSGDQQRLAVARSSKRGPRT